MNLGIDLSFLIPIDFWDYMAYAAFFVILAAIPAILNLRYDNEISLTQVLLFVFGAAGLCYTLVEAWFAAPSDGSLHYIALAFFALVLVVLTGINFVLKAECKIEGTSSYECFVSLFALAIFVIVTLISVLKAWFVIPPDGYMDYLRFACIWGIFSLLCAVGLAGLTLTHNNFKGDGLIFGVPGFFFFMEMVYSLLKTWNALPKTMQYTIIGVIAVSFLAVTGAFSAGTSGHSSE